MTCDLGDLNLLRLEHLEWLNVLDQLRRLDHKKSCYYMDCTCGLDAALAVVASVVNLQREELGRETQESEDDEQ